MIRELNTTWHSLPSNLGFAQDSAVGAKTPTRQAIFRACLVEVLRQGGLVGQLGYSRIKPPLLGFEYAIQGQTGQLALLTDLTMPDPVKVFLHLD